MKKQVAVIAYFSEVYNSFLRAEVTQESHKECDFTLVKNITDLRGKRFDKYILIGSAWKIVDLSFIVHQLKEKGAEEITKEQLRKV